MNKITALIIVLLIVSTGYFFLLPSSKNPAIIAQAPWAGSGITLIMDPHTHSNRRDGSLDEFQLLSLARRSGCDVLAITDYTDYMDSVGRGRLAATATLRERNDDILLFLGLELNIPSSHGREHIGLLVNPDHERMVLPQLRLTNEDDRDLDKRAFDLINMYTQSDADIVLIYNHPSSIDDQANENLADLVTWNSLSNHFIGFEGAPGHQKAAQIGDYQDNLETIDRWDPVVAVVGGAWDKSLDDGYNFRGALASSDFHEENLDYAPCTFSRTHVEVAEISHAAVLNALRAGTFWADHGEILESYNFTARLGGIDQPLYPGSIAQFGSDDRSVNIELNLERGIGARGAPLNIELISNCTGESPRMLASEMLPIDRSNFTISIDQARPGSDGESCYIRSRVRMIQNGKPDLMAYSNPIRFMF